ncbi:cation diffusion facilitator family transporter [Gracilibacillus dipsosauri]|uniref:Transporter n=1 Tax=Gracilibacillus dipsosauri TaxID=178340 RepID=A0A317KU27_9BACI|nr:cation diffusion facilitator family transporter [Gracilibacillus dipsosauri]PWU66783.1 transporter [Gracilibacillus dipsosauri]
MNPYEKYKKAEIGAWISIVAYLLLATIKLIVAQIGNSSALKADGLNNATDIIASVAVLIGLRISRKPPDEDHHYGHFRAEMIASLLAAFIMMTIGLQVLYDTIRSIVIGHYTEPNLLTAWVAIGSAIFMYLVYLYNLRLGKKVNSTALLAAAQDNKSDALVSIGAFIGIIGAQFQLFWLDPLAGSIVGIIICKTAWDIFREATHTLTDGFQPDDLEEIKQAIYSHSEVLEIKDVKGRMHGNQALIEATIFVDPQLTVEASHRITDHLEDMLKHNHNVPHTHIHIEPFKK